MDLQSFCVENRRKVHSFPLLRSSVKSRNMSQSFQFGMPVKGDIAEEHCFQNIQTMSCNAELAFQSVNKNSESSPKKSCFDHLNKFSSLSFSKVVGGFVGSKSQGGSASREPHQVWDVILRQLVDTACQTPPLHNNLHQYFNIGNSASHSIFGQFSGVGNSTLDFASYIISRPTDFFHCEKMSVDNHINSDKCLNGIKVSVNNILHSKTPSGVIQENMKNEHKLEDSSAQKQSYAEVAKSHSTSKLEPGCLPEIPNRSQTLSMDKRPMKCHRYFRKGQEKEARRERKSAINLEHSHLSSQHKQKKHSIPLDKFDEQQIPPKFIRDRFEYTRQSKQANSVYKHRTRDSNQLPSNCYPQDLKVSNDKKTRNFKSKNNYNMREKERKSIDFQVHEDVAYACNMPENECENWRCEHNRIPGLKRGRVEFLSSPQNCFSKYRKPIRFQSPPPRTFVIDSGRKNGQKIENISPEKKSEIKPKISDEIPKNCEKQDLNHILKSEDSNEAVLSSSPQILNTSPDRTRLISECSVDSEDSCIVFERDELDIPDDYSQDASESDTDSDNECDSNSVSTLEDCDEVDFQYIPLSQISLCIMPSENISDTFSPVPDRLKDINRRWQEENCGFSQDAKIPAKVHFARDDELRKLHPMVHWGFAYREARRGHWEEIGRDRCRFQMRIANAERELISVLDPEHRRKVWEERMCAALLA